MATLNELWIPSPHYSTNRGPYNKAVFHTTQGAMKIRDLGAWFQNPSAQCSSHHGADSYEQGVFGAYVYEDDKAWTQGNANDWCLSIELCGYAEWSRSEWLNNRPKLVSNAAEWLRYMVDKYKLPWTILNSSQAQNPDIKGITQHSFLGNWGSGHWDCGDGFPINDIVEMAKNWGGSAPETSEGILVSSAVAYYEGKQIIAYINQNGQVCVNGGAIPGSNAIGGTGLYINPDNGQKVVTYTNTSGHICTQTQNKGSNEWAWYDKQWTAK